MAEHNALGERGEKIALDYLSERGYVLLEKNYHFKHLEADLIMKLDELLVVVEVKTRQSDFMAAPEITVTRKKQKGIIKVANAYIFDNDLDCETRFDIVSIITNEKETTIEHIPDAFYPTL